VTDLHRQAVLGFLLALGASVPLCAAEAPIAGHTGSADPGYGVIGEYCSKCHNTEDWAGGIAFDTLSATTVPENGKTWEAAVRKLRGRLMPPPGNPQPSQARIDQLVGWLEGSLDSGHAGPRTGHVPVQRLNRTEYANAVRDLLAVEINPKDLLPPENEVEGFDNIAAALSVSPAFLDQYLGAARTVAYIAVGDTVPKVAMTFYAAPGGAQDSYVDGMPLGTRGGMSFRHNFPADGDYKINVLDLDIGLYPAAAETRHTLVVLIGGKEVFRADVGGKEDLATVDQQATAGSKAIMKRFQNIPVHVKAGLQDIVVTFIERSKAASDEYVSNGAGGFGGGGFDRLRVPRLLDGIQVVGPIGPATLSMSPSRAKIFVCQPAATAEDRACAEKIAQHLARRAYRRPVDATDLARLMPFYETGRKDGGSFDAGVQQLVTAVLASPDFLYRVIRPSGDGAPRALSDLELATRLAFFLWSQGPDDALIDLAAAGRLKDPQVLASQVKRMLADPRAGQLVEGFALKWLNLDELEQVIPDPKLFPGFNAAMREDFSKELVLFLKSVMLGDQSVLRILDADYTFLDERLARHYGITNVFGPQFRRVQLADDRRFGILGKAAMLLRTSYGDRTSPVLRGAWVLDKLMGTPPTPPPPNTATDLSQPPGEKPKTVRARLELHRANASCNVCHGVIDPIGLSLENYDAIGRWRDIDAAAQAKIDASTKLPSGVAISGPQQLRAELLKRPDQFVQALTQKLLMYGINREIEFADMPTVRAIVHASAQQDYTLSSIVLGIVSSDAFRLQAPPRAIKPLQARTSAPPSTPRP
jgi:hypothetical protein